MGIRKILVAAVVLGSLSATAVAQDFPKVEVFGGFSMLKLDTPMEEAFNDYVDLLAEEGVSHSTSDWLTKGFMASATFNVSHWLGIEANFQGNSGNLLEASAPGEVPESLKLKASEFTFMAGPRFALRKHEKVTPFAHVLFGMDRVKLESEYHGVGTGDYSYFDGSDTAFALAFGGGLDLNVHKNVAIRLIEVDFIRANHGEDANMNNINLAFGVVFRLGE